MSDPSGNRAVLLCLLIAIFLILPTCSPLYKREAQYASEISGKEYAKAIQLIDKDNFYHQKRNEILYQLELGRVNYLAGRYTESNEHFSKADSLIDNYRTDYSMEALSMFVNDNVKPYRSEDFENVILHYFRTINYLELGSLEDALVEIRQINLLLLELNDRYKDPLNHYSDDAFAEIFEGLIYERAGDTNNAFISYRNAAELFFENGKERTYFGVILPEQLKKDVLRTAHLLGFQDEVLRFEKLFGMKYTPQPKPEGGELILLWENGLGPVKDQWVLNFSIIQGKRSDQIVFANKQFGITFPVYHGNAKERNDMLNLQIIRMVLPKYIGRPHLFSDGEVTANGQSYPIELAINFNIIAQQCLRDRFLREVTHALVRLALKEAEEAALRKENETAGIILGVFNAATEQADTRSWQSIPSDIHYARIPLKKGVNEIKVRVFGHGGQSFEQTLQVNGEGRLVLERIITPRASAGLMDFGYAHMFN